MKNYLKLSAWLFLIPALMFSSCKDDDKSDGDPLLAPRNLVGLAGDGQVILNWDAPLSGEVKEYSVTWTPGNGSATVNGMAYTATGLTNDTEYTFSVKAVYASGSSDALTVKKTPKTEAINYTACTDVAAQAGYKAITLTWAVPEIVPKAELSGYTITVAPGEMEPIKVADPQAVSAVIDELANGTEYTVTIIADYKDGGMSAGVSVKATPTELISKVESDNVSKISFDKENAAIELYYTRPVDVEAIPVTFTLIEGATIDNESGAVSKTLNLKDPATVDVVMNDFTVPYQVTAVVDTLVKSLQASYDGTTVNGKVDQATRKILIDFGTTQIDKSAIEVTIDISENATLVNPSASPATMNLSSENAAIKLSDKYGNEVSYGVTCVGEEIPVVEGFNPKDITGKDIPADWVRLNRFNGKDIPATIAVYEIPETNSYVVMWKKGSDFTTYHLGKDAVPFADYKADYADENTILVSGTPHLQNAFHASQVVVKGGQGPMFAKQTNGNWVHYTGDWDGDTFFNFDTKENPWPVVEGFTGNGFYLNPGAPNGYTSAAPHTTTKKTQCFFAYHGEPSDADLAGFFVSGTASFTQDEVCEKLISIGLTRGFPINSIDQTTDNMNVGLTINGGDAVNITVSGGLDPVYAVGISETK